MPTAEIGQRLTTVAAPCDGSNKVKQLSLLVSLEALLVEVCSRLAYWSETCALAQSGNQGVWDLLSQVPTKVSRLPASRQRT